MRLFVAVGLSPEAARALRRIREAFAAASRDLRWSSPEGWHITLQFLGAVDPDQVACVQARLAEIQVEAVTIRLGGLGFFERAGIFYAGVSLTPSLLALEQEVKAATRACGFVPETRAYSPHITLARAKGRSGTRALEPLKEQMERAHLELAAEFTAAEFLLYESFPGPEGSRYEVRARFALGRG